MLDAIPPFSTDGDSFNSTKPDEIKQFVGKHFIYTYDNGWHYETYIKNAYFADFRIHSGLLAGRWVTDTKMHLVRITDDICKMSWSEPTGTCVSLMFDIAQRRMHGTIFFPQWIKQHPKEAIVYENAHDKEIQAFRNAGPTYPTMTVDEFAKITFMEDRGENDTTVIACSSKDLPPGFADRKN
jgi:phenolic acid decarboxylase